MTGCGIACADLQTDAKYCGACETACSTSHITAGCTAGQCSGACQAGYTDCNHDKRKDGCESESATDPMNCGGCGKPCVAGAPSCCGGACSDTKTDTRNCGACGNACGVGVACCGGTCSDPTSDAKNCGGCGKACLVGLACCGSACIDTTTNFSHCGGCGKACVAGRQSCAGGTCVTDYEWALWPMPNPAGLGLPNAALYDAADPDVVKDKVTGLTWEKDVDPARYLWDGTGGPGSVQAYCAGLAKAGGGWRLPTQIELYSLVDFTRTNPAIDPAFPGTPSTYFWSATADEGRAGSAWYVDFGFGTSYAGPRNAFRVRCVR
jgi:hypothetical protein